MQPAESSALPSSLPGNPSIAGSFWHFPGFSDLGLRGAAEGLGGATATFTLVFSHPDRVWEQKAWGNAASLDGHPRNPKSGILGSLYVPLQHVKARRRWICLTCS